LIVGAVVAAAVASAAVVLSRGSAQRGRIVFQAKVAGLYQLFTIKPDGSGLKQVTHLEMKKSSVPGAELPQWSPDGKLILFSSDYAATPKSVISLFTIKRDGSGLKRLPLSTGLFNGEGTWSPDGKNVAYTFDESNVPAHPQGIEVARSDGSYPYALTRTDNPATELEGKAAWSPSGDWIAFTEYFGQDQSQILKVRDVGGTPTPLTPFDLNADNARWSPDGTRLVFNSHERATSGDTANLFTVGANGKRLVQITHYPRGLRARTADWSPDGTEIIFQLTGTRADGSRVDQLFIMAAAGGPARQLTHFPVGAHPAHADWH
jgi:Tol biopolymer transport system component